MHIAITGGSGFIGTALTNKLIIAGHHVTIYDRIDPKLIHDDSIDQSLRNRISFVSVDLVTGSIPKSIAHHDAIVHLAGASIYGRWTKEYKQQIIESRTKSTTSIINACRAYNMSPENQLHRKPRVLVCASAIGYYGEQGDRIVDESTPAPKPGEDFLADVCDAWESAAQEIEALGIRRVSIRTAIVLGPDGGMMSKLIPLFKWGLGGRLGTGDQWFSWIHIDDLVAIYYEAITNPQLMGPVNATAPESVTNQVFTRSLAQALHRFAPWIIPRYVLRLLLGEFSRAILTSTRAIPKRLLEIGFSFKYPTIDIALKSIH